MNKKPLFTGMNAQNRLEHLCAMNIDTPTTMLRLSGIICTIGPACRSVEMLEKMILTGMNIARLNMSHHGHEYHAETIVNLRQAEKIVLEKKGYWRPIGIAMDTKGPEIRTGVLEAGLNAEVELKRGQSFKLSIDKSYSERGTVDIIFVGYENLTKVLKVGNRVFIDNGYISLIVTSTTPSGVICTVENGGMLGSRKNVDMPGINIDLPMISAKDREDLAFAMDQGVDMIFASGICEAEDIHDIREILNDRAKDIKVIAKIGNHKAMKNLDEIIEASDGILVARGDLGIEIPLDKVFLAQKSMISRCNKVSKPVICATQMLESMIKKPRATRSETSDIANAILDGADCVMLSGETAKGEYPIECVRTLANICKEAEAAIWHDQLFNDLVKKAFPPLDAAHGTAIAAVEEAAKCISSAIIVLTTSGRSAHLIASYRPRCPIIAITRHEQIARQCHLYRGIIPLYYPDDHMSDWIKDCDVRVQFGMNFGKKNNFIRAGDSVIVVTGWRQGTGFTNTLRIIYVEPEFSVKRAYDIGSDTDSYEDLY